MQELAAKGLASKVLRYNWRSRIFMLLFAMQIHRSLISRTDFDGVVAFKGLLYIKADLDVHEIYKGLWRGNLVLMDFSPKLHAGLGIKKIGTKLKNTKLNHTPRAIKLIKHLIQPHLNVGPIKGKSF